MRYLSSSFDRPIITEVFDYFTRRHEVMRNFLQQKATMVYNDMEIEPHLQETENYCLQKRVNPQDKSRSDIRINGFNRGYQNSFLDVKIMNIQANFHENTVLPKHWSKQRMKKTKNTRQGSKMLKMVLSTQLYSLQKEEDQESVLW